MDQVEGRNPVIEALQGRRQVKRVLLAKGIRGAAVDRIVQMAAAAGVSVEWVPREQLDRMAKTRQHQGVIALAEPLGYVDVGELLAAARQAGEPPLLLACAHVEDPQNLGSLIRSAHAGGVHGIILPRHRSAGISPATARASAGAVEYIPIAQVTNLSRTLRDLKREGLWAVAASPQGDRDYFDVDLTMPTVIVVGSEGRGIPRLVQENCDFIVRIPMKGRVGSLNVAVAGALIIFEALRQRLQSR